MFIVTFLLMLSPQMIKSHSQYSGWQRLKCDISLLTRNMTTKWNKISILCRVHSSSDHAHSSSALSRFDDVFVPCSVFDNIQTSTKSILLFLYFSFQTFLTKEKDGHRGKLVQKYKTLRVNGRNLFVRTRDSDKNTE